MMKHFIEHANAMNIKIEREKSCKYIAFDDYFMVNVNGEIVEAKKVILAGGVYLK